MREIRVCGEISGEFNMRIYLQSGLAFSLAFLMMGCAHLNMNFMNNLFVKHNPVTGETVVVGKLSLLSVSTEKSLRGMGLKVDVKQVKDAVHISSVAPNGSRFTIIMSQVNTPQGISTKIQTVWEGEIDIAMQARILGPGATVPGQNGGNNAKRGGR